MLSLAGCTASLLTARASLISFLLLFFLPADIKDGTGSESDGGDSCSTKSDGGSVTSASEIQPKKVKGIGFGDIFKDKAIKLRPRSMDVDSELGTPSEKVAAALYSYVLALYSKPGVNWNYKHNHTRIVS